MDNPFADLPSRRRDAETDDPFAALPDARRDPNLSNAMRSVGLGDAFVAPGLAVPRSDITDDPVELARRREVAQRQAEAQAVGERYAAALNPPTLLDDLRTFGAAEWEGLGSAFRGVGGLWQAGYNTMVGEPLSALTGEDQTAGNPFGELADAISGVGARQRERTTAGYQQLRRDNQIGGELLDPSTWTLGDDPSVRGVIANGVDVMGSLAPVLAATYLSGGSAAAGAAAGGAQGGGAAMEQASQTIDDLYAQGKLGEQSEVFRDLVASGVPEAQALAETRRRAEEWAFALTTPISSLGGAATSKIVHPASTLLATRPLAARVVAGGALSGAEEAAQETAEGVATQLGINQGAGTDLDPLADSFGNAVLGFLGGAGPGAAGGAMRGRAPAAEEPAERLPRRSVGEYAADMAAVLQGRNPAAGIAPVASAAAPTPADDPFAALPTAKPASAPASPLTEPADELDSLLLASERRAAEQLQAEQPVPSPEGAVAGGGAAAPAPTVGAVTAPAEENPAPAAQLRVEDRQDALPQFTRRGYNDYLTDEKGEPRDFLTYGSAREEAERVGGRVLVDDAQEGQRPTWSVVRDDGRQMRVEQPAYHGTPHTVDRFSLQKIGTGEGAQAYGWGMYFAGRREVADWYRTGLSNRDLISKARNAYDEFADPQEAIDALREEGINDRQAELLDALAQDDWLGFDYPHQAISAALRDAQNFDLSDRTKAALANLGNLYQVEIPEDSDLLDWDKPLSEQPTKVRDAIARLGEIRNRSGQDLLARDPTGEAIYRALGEPETASGRLREAGIQGLRYLDGSSRRAGEGTHNYVVWDEDGVSDLQRVGEGEEVAGRDTVASTRGDRAAGTANGRQDENRDRRENPDSGRAGARGLDSSGVRPRPDGTPSVLRRREYALESFVRRFGGSVLGATIAEDFERTETAQLINQTIGSDADLAAAASVYRDPAFETLRYVFVDASGVVLGESAVSSRMAASSAAFPEDDGLAWLERNAKRYKAAGIWFIHNHPSGDPTPSLADVSFTRSLRAELASRLPALRVHGHVVLNHDKYSFIRANGDVLDNRPIRTSGPDPLENRRGVLIGQTIMDPASAAEAGAAAYNFAPKDSVAVIVTDSHNKITTAATLPLAVMRTPRGAALVSSIAKRSRGTSVFLAGEYQAINANMAGIVRLNEMGLARDVVAIHPDGSVSSVFMQRTRQGKDWHNRGTSERDSGATKRRSVSAVEVFEPGPGDSFADQVRGRLASGDARGPMLVIGKTPAVLRMLGFPDLSLRMPPGVLFKLATGKGGDRAPLTEKQIAKLPEWLDDPVAIFRSADNDGVVAVTKAVDSAGKPIVIAARPNVTDGLIQVNLVPTAFGKDRAEEWVERNLSEDRLLYAGESVNPRLPLPGLAQYQTGAHIGGSRDETVRPEEGARQGRVLTAADLRQFRQKARTQNLQVQAPSTAYTPAQTEALRKAGLATSEPTSLENLSQRLREAWTATAEQASQSAADNRRQSVVDRFHGLRAAEGQVPFEQSAYIAARMSTGLPSIMEAILLYGAPEWKDGVMSIKPGSKGLADALQPVRADIRDWLGWMVGRRAQLLKSQGRENNLSDAEIQELLSLDKGKEAAFKQAATDYAKLKTAILDVAEEAGLIDPVGRAAWDHAEYLPFYREDDGKAVGPGTRKGLAGQTSGIRTLKGGEQVLADPLSNIIRNFTKLVDASLKNHASLLAIDGIGAPTFKKAPHEFKQATVPLSQVKKHLADAGVPQQQIDALPAGALEGIKRMMQIVPPTGENVVRVMRDGKAEYYEVDDPLVLRALTAFKQPQVHVAIRPLVWAKNLLTAGVTSTAEFVAANAIRDTGSTWLFTDQPVRHLLRVAKGALQTIRRDKTTRDLMMAGASFVGGHYYSGRPEDVAKHLRRALTAKGLKGKPLEDHLKTIAYSPALLWRGWLRLSEAIENANRNALYEAGRAEGKGRLQAAYESKDLMDFSMRGDSQIVQFFADVLPFFNARLQGLYKVGREGKANPRRILVRGALMALASSALMAWNLLRYKDDYDELEEWDKDAYWHIAPGTEYHIRIPKPFELGILFATLPERFLNTAFGDATGNEAVQSFLHNLSGTLAMNPIPQVAMPVAEQWANKKFFTGGPIEKQSDQKKKPEDRAEWYTSDTMKQAGKATGLSPKRLEHLWRGYTGGLGGYVLETSDWLTRRLTDAPEQPELSLRDYPLVGRFARGDSPAQSTKYITEFYDLMEDAEQAEQSLKDSLLEGKDQRAEDIQSEWAWLFGKKLASKQAKAGISFQGMKEMRAMRDSLAGDRRAVEAAAMSRTLSPEQKRAEIDRINGERNKRIEEFVKRTREQRQQVRKAA